jgi:hypothetical protein
VIQERKATYTNCIVFGWIPLGIKSTISTTLEGKHANLYNPPEDIVDCKG